MKPIDNEEDLLEKLREKLGPAKKQDDRAELERLFGKKTETEEDKLRAKLVRPTVNQGDVIDVTIEKLAFGGEGIGRHKNVPIFVYGVVPGDTVRVTLTKVTKDMCRGDILEFTARSSNRIPPRCPLFGRCGGCHLQCLVYTAQLKAKETMAADVLTRIGNIDTRVRSVIGSPESFGYRIRTRLHTDRHEGKNRIGYFARRSNDIVELQTCPLLAKPLNDVIQVLPDILPAPGTAPLPEEIHLQLSVDSGQIVIHCISKEPVFGVESLFDNCLKRQLPVSGVSAQTKSGFVVSGDINLMHRIGSYNFSISGNSFIQANQYLQKNLIDQVIQISSPAASDNVLDLYCGSGFFSLPLARFVQSLIGLDNNESAIHNARKNAEQAGLKNTDFCAVDDRRFFQLPEVYNSKISLLVADPPRNGLSPEVLKGIISLKPAKFIYISCDPSTLARDLKALTEADFKVRLIQPIDLFPHTFHIETLVFLTHKLTGTQAAYQAFSDLR